MASELLPRPQGPLFDPRTGHPLPEWFDFWSAVADAADAAESDAERITLLEAAVAALQEAGVTVEIIGPASVRVLGSSADGYVLTLDGDDPAPGASHYYGTDTDGAKGWHERLLATLADVDLTDLADGDLLAWDATAEAFIPYTVPPASLGVLPVVTGEKPPVFVYGPDGSLIYLPVTL